MSEKKIVKTDPTLSHDEQIIKICEQFVEAISQGDAPEIENYIRNFIAPKEKIDELFLHLLKDEIELCQKTKTDCPSFIERFPVFRQAVEEAFANAPDNAAEASEETCLFATSQEETIVVKNRLKMLQGADDILSGGMGIVQRAKDENFDRHVAVKYLKDQFKEDQDEEKKLLQEAKITAGLEHPGIVSFLGAGETKEGKLCYVMQFLKGGSLEDKIAKYYNEKEAGTAKSYRLRFKFHELLNHFVLICNTVAYAHKKGILHCDIKPLNIMIGKYGETMLVDWGMAVPFGEDAFIDPKPGEAEKQEPESEPTIPIPNTIGLDQIEAESRIASGGTIGYMSPEQLYSEELTATSDIYGLGGTLYKILTGKPCLSVSSRSALIRVRELICNGDFPKPREVDPKISKVLEAICLKCMATNSEDRYQNGLEVAKDIDRYLSGVPISQEIYRETISEKLRRYSRAHWSLVSSTVSVLMIAAAMGLLLLGWRADAQAQRAEVQSQRYQNERQLRIDNLQLSASTIASSIGHDIYNQWGILEKEVAFKECYQELIEINTDPADEKKYQKMQAWLDRTAFEKYSDLTENVRSWSIYAIDGTQIARSPLIVDGEKASSIGKSFAFRNYFHGQSRGDYPEEISGKPIKEPLVSTALFSSIDGKLTFALAVPIFDPQNHQVIGVITLAHEVGEFINRNSFSNGDQTKQNILLIESRTYPLSVKRKGDTEESHVASKGLVLDHPLLAGEWEKAWNESGMLPHVSDYVKSVMHKQNNFQRQDNANTSMMLSSEYRDPLQDKSDTTKWYAVMAPVRLPSYGSKPLDTDWYVIVQQKQVDSTK